MDGRFGGSPIREEQAAPTGELRPAAPSSPSHKRSRRSLQKRVVTIPIGGGEDGSRAKGAAGDGAPPSDSWAWRKYGQKPIKGSPYPRGYYRCSSSKGCPARKQVERSRVDPTMLLVTYSCDHNHPWPLPKNHHHHHHHHHQNNSNSNAADNKQLSPPAEEEPAPAAPAQLSPPEMAADRDERFADLIGEEDSTLMLAGEFGWLSADVGSPSSATEIICGPIFGGGGGSRMFPEESEKLSGSGEDEEEDSLFAGLGELPECSAVFRRSLAVTAAASSW